jgi:hypothetical protein
MPDAGRCRRPGSEANHWRAIASKLVALTAQESERLPLAHLAMRSGL